MPSAFTLERGVFHDIYDPDGSLVVDGVSMALSGDYYVYIYQSESDGTEGKYKAIANAVKDSYTGSSREYFTLDKV